MYMYMYKCTYDIKYMILYHMTWCGVLENFDFSVDVTSDDEPSDNEMPKVGVGILSYNMNPADHGFIIITPSAKRVDFGLLLLLLFFVS